MDEDDEEKDEEQEKEGVAGHKIGEDSGLDSILCKRAVLMRADAQASASVCGGITLWEMRNSMRARKRFCGTHARPQAPPRPLPPCQLQRLHV
jgi:hypothetical protein